MIKRLLRFFYAPVVNWHYTTFRAPKRYHHLYDEIERIKATSIVEVGTWNGKRAAQMINKAQSVSAGPVSYVGFDLFEGLDDALYEHEISKRPPQQREVTERLEETGADITLVQGNTLETLPAYVQDADPADFIFIDGGHSVETVRSDWNAVKQLMTDKTVVIFDDYWRNRDDESAKPVVDAIDRNEYDVEILPEIDVFSTSDFGRLEISFAKVTKK